MSHNCPLCNSKTNLFYQDKKHIFFECETCKLISRPAENIPSIEAEKLRYDKHDNSNHTEGYKAFVAPIIVEVTTHYSPSDFGLDFGSGPNSIIISELKKHNYNCVEYDLFYLDNTYLLQKKYDYITACEVIEHFREPYKEFKMLKNMLAKNGRLICKTDIYSNSIDFKSWYYKNDPTHIIIFRTETFDWITKEFGFSETSIFNRVITFKA